MIHYSCDRCQKKIDCTVDLRYEVNIVTQIVLDDGESAATESHIGLDSSQMDVDSDHLNDVDELLKRVDAEQCEQLCQDLYQSRRFDLCSTCYQQYKRDPLGIESQLQVEFSEN